MTDFELIEAPALGSPLRESAIAEGVERHEAVLRIGLVQCSWDPDGERHRATLADGLEVAARAGVAVVFLQELTLSPYFCHDPAVADALDRFGEDLETGPTVTFARANARRHGIAVHASLYERVGDRGYNTAVCVGADGALLVQSRKTHIPAFPSYHEDRYFEPADRPCGIAEIGGVQIGFPTCWDQWFPELARSLSMRGAEVVVYPTAIGSEPHVPGFDSQPMWHQTIVANGLANATFMIAVNRIGTEGPIDFYGSSFVSDPYGRVLAEAPRERPAVIVADLEIGQRADWASFGLLWTRQPSHYGELAGASDLGRPVAP